MQRAVSVDDLYTVETEVWDWQVKADYSGQVYRSWDLREAWVGCETGCYVPCVLPTSTRAQAYVFAGRLAS